MKFKTIIITGTPGTGKTTIAKNSAKKLNFLNLDINQTIKKYKIKFSYDKKRKCKIIDIKKLNKALISEIKLIKTKNSNSEFEFFGIIIDSHLSHYLPKRYVDLCIVAKCNLKILKKRLEKRHYGKNKIRENLDAEIFDTCYTEALEAKHKIIIIDTSKKVNYQKIIKIIKKTS